MTEKIILAGFGGQGIELSGELLAQAMLYQGQNVTFFPSYGAQVRGGHACCHVVISSGEICSPLIETPDTLIVMNQPSYERYGDALKEQGMLIVNSSMVEPHAGHGADPVAIPASERALQLGNVLVANMMMLGAYHAAKGLLHKDAFLQALAHYLTGRKAALLDIDTRAFELGAELVRKAG